MASNNNNTYEKGPLPTFTIVDSVDKQSSYKFRSCCVCLPERTGVIIIFSFYVLSGFLSSVASFFYLSLYPDTLDKVLLVISGILYALLCVSGASGLSFIRKDNAVMMNKLSIATWVLTGLILTYNLTVYILEVVFKSSAVQQCQEDFNQGPDPSDDIDCNQAVNIVLVKDAMKLIFTELFSLYFSYVISRFSKKMLEDSKKPILPYSVDQDGPATPYTVYVTRPPTSHNWIPPPTYTVRANDVPSDTKNAPVLS